METNHFTDEIIAMYPELLYFAYKLTADKELARDLVQDSILKALDNENKYVHQVNLRGWVFTIMRNIFINNYRRSARELSLIDYNITDAKMAQIITEERHENIYDSELLYRAIDDLPKILREPFVMHFTGLKYKEIAEKTNSPIGTIKSRIHFARKQLQKVLKDLW